MTDQLALFDTTATPYGVSYSAPSSPVVAPHHTPTETLDQRFNDWIAANPHVLDVFIQHALHAQRAGRQRIGAKRIIEQMRWDIGLNTTGDPFRINNNFTSRLVRLAIAARPELDPLFEQRGLRS